jgi:hypothetical protein
MTPAKLAKVKLSEGHANAEGALFGVASIPCQASVPNISLSIEVIQINKLESRKEARGGIGLRAPRDLFHFLWGWLRDAHLLLKLPCNAYPT